MQLRTLALASTAIVALGLASSAAPVTTTTTQRQQRQQRQQREKQKSQLKGERTKKQLRQRQLLSRGHCVTSLTKPGNPTTCYDTFTAVIAAATGGKVTDAPADPRVAMNDKSLAGEVERFGR